ncbi:ATP-dependent RNA helicase HrpA [Halothiobacillus diazotrophicus]|uniref:ATP-dependent RNA helicase HrpA n=2 Tax=Halothiobacillus diazotrophicus TaxID=1860122 RepID=A0A191ZIN1_9GAMM|nr:ATP-dependent RNA helicase HrpA [Halothiobacillus diazotrophicus]
MNDRSPHPESPSDIPKPPEGPGAQTPDPKNPEDVTAFLRAHLDQLPLSDVPRLARRLAGFERSLRAGDGGKGQRDPAHPGRNGPGKAGRAPRTPDTLATLVDAFEASAALVTARRGHDLKFDYPDDLPVSGERTKIMDLLRAHPVVIVAGETGSGKTTQLPKMLLELGYGLRGQVGHTQPRRIAARNVASRLAEELGSAGAQAVGYKVRFSDQTQPTSRVAVMTDGILLAEINRDPDLLRYDALIIDEAHERSLNIDFLLGILRQLIERRPDFRLVITSATIDTARFAQHFARLDPATGSLLPAPVVPVSGRSYPVEIRYRPLDASRQGDDAGDGDAAGEERDLPAAVVAAVDELIVEGLGDILVFLPGEREIRDCAQRLSRHGLRHTEILPLYARLSTAEQQRVFAPHTGRRVVLTTNVAETSLTVPGIHYVIDSGLARIARYSPRSRVQKLAVEAISQASAKQRAGRCGRIAPGICIRLYDEADFTGRPAFTNPEILRTNLASVVLRLIDLKLGEPEHFPFIEPPDSRQLAAARRLLFELHGLDGEQRITTLGRRLARLPVDPTLARMVLAALSLGDAVAVDTLIVVAFLSIQDPRERPADHAQAADQAQQAFRVADSDFAAVLSLWHAWHQVVRHESQRQRRAWAKRHFLSYNRLLEWHDLFGQLRQIVDELNQRALPDAQPVPGPGVELAESDKSGWQTRLDQLHQAILPGLLAQIGMRDEAQRADRTEKADQRGQKKRTPTVYIGANNRRFMLFPGSGVAKLSPKWVMSAEIVETTRVYARMVAAINPRWIEPLAGHLTTREHSEPQWDQRGGRVMAFETVKLFGLPIVTKRRIDFGRIDPLLAREIFIRSALVEGAFESNLRFWRDNQALISEIRELEARTRRPDLLIDDQVIFDFYASHLPADVHDTAGLVRWLKEVGPSQPTALCMTRDDVLKREPDQHDPKGFPDRLQMGAFSLPLHYHFAPGSDDDGVTLRLPLAALNQIDAARASHLIPGLRREKIEALIRGLPKADRRHFVPAPEFAAAVNERIAVEQGDLIGQLATELHRMTGHRVDPELFDERKLLSHLRMRFAVVNDAGEELDADRDLTVLVARHQAAAQQAFAQRTRHRLERDDLTDWSLGDLPEQLTVEQQGAQLQAYPALVDAGDHVRVALLDDAERALAAHRAGVTRLLMLALPEQVRHLMQYLKQERALDPARLQYSQLSHRRPLPEQGLVLPNRRDVAFDTEIVARAVAGLAVDDRPPVRDASGFAERVEWLRPRLDEAVRQLAEQLRGLFAQHQALRARLKGRLPLSQIEAAREVAEQFDALIYPGFIWYTPQSLFGQLPRYLTAAEKRLEKIDRHPERDRMLRVQFMPLCSRVLARIGQSTDDPAEFLALCRLQEQLEEWRVATFAQELARKGAPAAPEIEQSLKRF